MDYPPGIFSVKITAAPVLIINCLTTLGESSIAEGKYLIVLGIAAFIGALLATVQVRRWAVRHGFVDHPGGHKTHVQPVPLGGGIVIFWVTMLPMVAALLCAVLWSKTSVPAFLPKSLSQHIEGLAGRTRLLLTLIIAAAVLHVVGLIDDKRPLGAKFKLLAQFAAVSLPVVVGGIRFQFFITNFWITVLLSMVWMVVIINAFNFLDNMDGLSAGIGLICSAMILSAAWTSGQVFVSALLLILIGTLGGFLVFNFAPARIYMGDAGSLVVGLLISAATIQTTYYHEHSISGVWFNTLMPLIVLAVPLYDFVSVTLIRLCQGKNPLVGDQQHFSHRLVQRGMSTRQAVLTIYLATACTGLGATFLNQLSSQGCVLVFVQTILILFIIAILERPAKI